MPEIHLDHADQLVIIKSLAHELIFQMNSKQDWRRLAQLIARLVPLADQGGPVVVTYDNL